jgi:ATP-dependent exoDNAse (exonuclease V) beta subunit
MNVFKELECVTLESGKRHYVTPEGKKYPSITTILSATGDKSFLDEWKKRVGEEEAKRITTEATTNGSAMHNILEAYCKKVEHTESNKVAEQMAKFGKRQIDKHLSFVVQTEAPLYSDRLGVAGRTDMICIWDELLTVLDYKNRGFKDFKTEKQCFDYKLQICFYSQAIYERCGRKPKKGLILQLNTFSHNTITFDPFDYDLCAALDKRIRDYKNQ